MQDVPRSDCRDRHRFRNYGHGSCTSEAVIEISIAYPLPRIDILHTRILNTKKSNFFIGTSPRDLRWVLPLRMVASAVTTALVIRATVNDGAIISLFELCLIMASMGRV